MRKTDIKALSNCAIFSTISEETVTAISESEKYETATFEKGYDIFSPDNYRKSLAVILKGSATVSKRTAKGTLYMSTLNESDIFGMSNIFYDEDTFPTCVTAKEDVRVLFITKEQLLTLFAKYPDILDKYMCLLSKKIHFLNEKIESFSASDASQALKDYLLKTANRIGSNTFSLPVSCSTLSNLLGIGRTSLYRSFEELTKEGFLKKDGKVITII